MIRRQLITAVVVVVLMTLTLGLVYPLVVTGFAQVAFHNKANDSLVKVNGKVVGSSLLGQNFTDKDGNPLPKYFQPRPSAAGDGYDALSSSASNLGPSNPKLIGNVPGVAIGDDGKPLTTNPYATASDPYCVPVQSTDKDGNDVTDKAGNAVYDKNKDGSYVCDANTVPQRAIAYRALNDLAADREGAGRRRHRVGFGSRSRHLDCERRSAGATRRDRATPSARDSSWRRSRRTPTAAPSAFLGEKAVNVLELNLGLDKLGH